MYNFLCIFHTGCAWHKLFYLAVLSETLGRSLSLFSDAVLYCCRVVVLESVYRRQSERDRRGVRSSAAPLCSYGVKTRNFAGADFCLENNQEEGE